MQGPLSLRTRGALALALSLLPLASSALILGEVEVRSALGEPLDARIALTLAEGESVDAKCFTLLTGGGSSGAPLLTEGLLQLSRSASGASTLRVRSMAPVLEPAVALRLRAACPGAMIIERTYDVLLDPRPGSQVAVAPPSAAATLRAAPGDTLESFAQRVYPEQDAARGRYLDALRERNPAFAGNAGKAPLPEGARVVLPDLRDSARERRAAPRARETAAPRQEAARDPAIAASVPAADAPKRAAEPKGAPAKAARRQARMTHASGSPFELRLSSSEVDLARSRGIDERKRAQLRERLLALDSDDHVAAMLSLKNSMRQRETRVAELQLKLSAPPPSLAARSEPVKAEPAQPPAPQVTEPPKAEPPKPVPAPPITATRTETAKVEPPKAADPPRAEAPKPEAPKPEPPKAEPATPETTTAEPPKAQVPIPQPAPVPPALAPNAQTSQSAAGPKPGAALDDASWIPGVPDHWLLGGLAALIVLLIAALTWRARRRAPEEARDANVATVMIDDDSEPVVEARTRRVTPGELAAANARPQLASDAGLSTRLPENSRELRRRYIEERFPEIANRTLVLDDPASVVKTARLFYEDGELHRAVELLQFCIEDRPQEVRTWLALFEIFRLERLTGEFADLARRFHQHHGASAYWPKVQYFGREIDPTNVLYREDSINTLETIGPAQARALAAAASFDPIAENWLDAPMDFENEVLANELRQALMARANLTEQDLVANPMPALRSVQMFTVA